MAADTATEAPPDGAIAPVAAPAEPRAPEKKGAKGDAKAKDAKQGAKGEKDAKGKGEKDTKGKGKKQAKEAEPDGDGPSVAAHPRAVRAVARAKSWGGLAGFVLGGYLSLPTNTLAGAGLRALVAGMVCYVAVWAGAVFVWRRLVMLEIKSREQQLAAAVQAARARRELPAPAERPGARVAS